MLLVLLLAADSWVCYYCCCCCLSQLVVGDVMVVVMPLLGLIIFSFWGLDDWGAVTGAIGVVTWAVEAVTGANSEACVLIAGVVGWEHVLFVCPHSPHFEHVFWWPCLETWPVFDCLYNCSPTSGLLFKHKLFCVLKGWKMNWIFKSFNPQIMSIDRDDCLSICLLVLFSVVEGMHKVFYVNFFLPHGSYCMRARKSIQLPSPTYAFPAHKVHHKSLSTMVYLVKSCSCSSCTPPFRLLLLFKLLEYPWANTLLNC